MFEFLDTPRQALSNMVSGISEGDLGKAAPGLLGALLTGGLAATGVGLPLAVLAGSALGGTGQSLFGQKAQSADQFGGSIADALGLTDDSTARDITKFLGTAASDPLSYAGLGLGSRAGAGLGNALERAAIARGPGYGTTAEELLSQIGRMDTSGLPVRVRTAAGDFVHPLYNELSKSPYAAQIAAEVPQGSSILGAGAEGIAFGTPSGDVLRLGRANPMFQGRPNVDQLLQPTRSLITPNDGMRLLAERLPMAQGVGSEAAGAATPALQDALRGQALNFSDRTAANAGFVNGVPKVIDPGAITNLGYSGSFSPMIQAGQAPGGVTSRLLDLLGSDQALQRALAGGNQSLGYGRMGGLLGGSLGGLIGSNLNGLE